MALKKEYKKEIQNVIMASLRNKFETYNPEPASMPFHFRLLGKDRMALYSFIHSLATNFGTTIFEPVAKKIALVKFKCADTHCNAGNFISSEAQKEIQSIIDKLETAEKSPNKTDEIIALRNVCQKGEMKKVKLTRVDLKLVENDGSIHLTDIKTAKPNAGGFKEFKRTLLEWVAATLAADPTAKIHTFISIPYNPYEPQPYSRWTMRGMLDLDHEMKVAEEFWDFLGGENTYSDLLDCFEKAGIALRPEIDDYFARFNKG
jgi:type II restriction enzyme